MIWISYVINDECIAVWSVGCLMGVYTWCIRVGMCVNSKIGLAALLKIVAAARRSSTNACILSLSLSLSHTHHTLTQTHTHTAHTHTHCCPVFSNLSRTLVWMFHTSGMTNIRHFLIFCHATFKKWKIKIAENAKAANQRDEISIMFAAVRRRWLSSRLTRESAAVLWVKIFYTLSVVVSIRQCVIKILT